jgi:threonine synthase
VTAFHFSCVECGANYPEALGRLLCDVCSRLQTEGGTTRGVLEVVIETLPGEWLEGYSSPEFLTSFMPIPDGSYLPSLEVGNTPLLKAERLGRELDVQNVWVKDDTRNPSGSTKDRASQLVVAKASEYGIDTIAAASTGNAATALAAMAASAGKRAIAFVPASAPEAKLVQMQSCGAELIPVNGTYDDAFDLCLEACSRFGWYNRNTAINPFTTEGKKTMALEIAHQIRAADGSSADVVVVPTGDGVIIAGIARGFDDLVRAGLLEASPRLIAVQPERSSAIATALRDGTEVRPDPHADSVADSLNVSMPRNAVQCLKYVRACGGSGVIVTDDDILEAIPLLGRTTGVFGEPAAVASVAGLKCAVAEGLIDRDERVVLAVTGSGLKDPGSAARAVSRPEPIEPVMEELERFLAATS